MEASEEEDWRAIVVVPLTFPLSDGDARAAIAIGAVSGWDTALDLIAISLVNLVVVLILFATHYFSGPLVTRLSQQNMGILARISGIVLVAIAAQLLIRGTIELAVDVELAHLLSNMVG